jgi:hypothetical protein
MGTGSGDQALLDKAAGWAKAYPGWTSVIAFFVFTPLAAAAPPLAILQVAAFVAMLYFGFRNVRGGGVTVTDAGQAGREQPASPKQPSAPAATPPRDVPEAAADSSVLAVARPTRLASSFFLRPTLRLYRTHIELEEPGLFSRNTRRVKTGQVTQVDVRTGVLRSELNIYASGQGTVRVKGLRKSDALKMRDVLDSVTG